MAYRAKSGTASRRNLKEEEIRIIRVQAFRKKVKQLYKILSSDEKEKADKFTVQEAKDRFIISRAVLRQVIAKKMRVKPESVVFAYGPHGKPQYDAVMTGVSLGHPFHFNVSHSNGLILICTGTSPIGIDVERIRKITNLDRVAARILSPRKVEVFRSLPEKIRYELLLNIWTRKEAIVKALGCGLAVPVKNFEVWKGDPKKPFTFLSKVLVPDQYLGTIVLNSRDVKVPRPYVGAVSSVSRLRSKRARG